MTTEVKLSKFELALWRELDNKLRMQGKGGITKRQFLALSDKERADMENAALAEKGDAGSTF